jgi:UDP-N-acetylglucosamine diphosphorylase / glucose-1-phosphate thymidylyltransferase / UDP-N-acetylgalactosamine diphosphorylase / glucosamine-1-phosphate N-acetyltransferase / galactosamine-1-phosphate N-acetyltransferase
VRLILIDPDTPSRRNFYPIALSRPIWELRCGITSLREKIIAKTQATDIACFCPEHIAPVYRIRSEGRVNDPASLKGSDLLLINPRLKAEAIDKIDRKGGSQVGRAKGEVLYAWIRAADAGKLDTSSLASLLESAQKNIATKEVELPTWGYTWDIVLASPHQIIEDFKTIGRSGIEGTVEQPNAIRGSKSDVFIAKGVKIHPMVVIDAENGPVYLDEEVQVHPFTRIEGPCFVGKKSWLLGTKCREGNSIGPNCRVGGEVEESVIHAYSNKYHDGFLGHAYVGEWVNLGALTTNSDLKNDYGNVEVMLDGRTPTNTGSVKVGALIGDHTKTSIGTLFNSGAYVGAMCLIMSTGKPLPKYIPEFSWLIDGLVTKGFGKGKLYDTAKIAMSRRKMEFTEADRAMWEAVFEMTAPQRDDLIKRGRRKLGMGK